MWMYIWQMYNVEMASDTDIRKSTLIFSYTNNGRRRVHTVSFHLMIVPSNFHTKMFCLIAAKRAFSTMLYSVVTGRRTHTGPLGLGASSIVRISACMFSVRRTISMSPLWAFFSIHGIYLTPILVWAESNGWMHLVMWSSFAFRFASHTLASSDLCSIISCLTNTARKREGGGGWERGGRKKNETELAKIGLECIRSHADKVFHMPLESAHIQLEFKRTFCKEVNVFTSSVSHLGPIKAIRRSLSMCLALCSCSCVCVQGSKCDIQEPTLSLYRVAHTHIIWWSGDTWNHLCWHRTEHNICLLRVSITSWHT